MPPCATFRSRTPSDCSTACPTKARKGNALFPDAAKNGWTRRILPAAFAMVCATLVGASMIMLPQEAVSAAQQALAVLAFCSNVLFWSQQSYFDAASITKPLLHTWSLGVEEQYYVLFPVLALAAFALRRSLMLASLVGVCAASFLLCVIQTRLQPAAAFYCCRRASGSSRSARCWRWKPCRRCAASGSGSQRPRWAGSRSARRSICSLRARPIPAQPRCCPASAPPP